MNYSEQASALRNKLTKKLYAAVQKVHGKHFGNTGITFYDSPAIGHRENIDRITFDGTFISVSGYTGGLTYLSPEALGSMIDLMASGNFVARKT